MNKPFITVCKSLCDKIFFKITTAIVFDVLYRYTV